MASHSNCRHHQTSGFISRTKKTDSKVKNSADKAIGEAGSKISIYNIYARSTQPQQTNQ